MEVTDYHALMKAEGLRSMNALGRALGMPRDVARGCMSRLAKSGRPPAEAYRAALQAMLDKHGLNGTAVATTPLDNAPNEFLGEQDLTKDRELGGRQGTCSPVTTADPIADWSAPADAVVVEDEEDEDPDDAVDIRGLTEYVRAWAAEQDAEPDPGAVTDLLAHLASEGATELVVEDLLDQMAMKWWKEARAKDRDRKRSAITKAWQREVRDLRALVREEQEPPPETRPDLDPQTRAATRAELWPRVRELTAREDLLAASIQQVHDLGVVGEDSLITLVLLSGVSRILDRPVCPLITGASASGKSFGTENTLRLLPEEDVIHMTTGSALSLVYEPADVLKHRVLCVYEATQLENDDNSVFALNLRTLLSEGRIIHKTVQTDADGNRYTETIVQEGPVALVVTTTATDLHAENSTRMTRLSTHEDCAQTRAILDAIGRRAQRAASEEETSAGLGLWQDFHRWLAAGPREVVIPYASKLTAGIPPVAVRFRRDVDAILGLIRGHALLYQAQRGATPGGAVIADLDDYRAVFQLASLILEESAGKRPSERVVAVVQHVQAALAGMAETTPNDEPKLKRRPAQGRRVFTPHRDGEAYVVSVRSLGELLGLDRKSAEHAIRRALDDGFIVNEETGRGKPMRLVMGPRSLSEVGVNMLPHPDSLQ